jgi:hypothetical protein
MVATSEATVQVPPNSTGGVVRMLQVTVLDSGVPTTVLMQVMQIADEFGTPIGFSDYQQAHQEMVDELRAIRLGIQKLLDNGALPNETFNLIQVAREIRFDTDDPVTDAE